MELTLQTLASILGSKNTTFDLTSIGMNQEKVLQYSVEFPGTLSIYNQSKSWLETRTELKVKDWHDLPASVVKQIQDLIDNSPKGN